MHQRHRLLPGNSSTHPAAVAVAAAVALYYVCFVCRLCRLAARTQPLPQLQEHPHLQGLHQHQAQRQQQHPLREPATYSRSTSGAAGPHTCSAPHRVRLQPGDHHVLAQQRRLRSCHRGPWAAAHLRARGNLYLTHLPRHLQAREPALAARVGCGAVRRQSDSSGAQCLMWAVVRV